MRSAIIVAGGLDLKVMHFCINVKNLERSIRFYRDLLGLRLARRREVPENNAEIVFMLGEGSDVGIELTHWRDKKEYVEGDYLDHIALGVEDVEATVERLRKIDVEIAMEPFSLKGSEHKMAFIKDPDGIWIELVPLQR